MQHIIQYQIFDVEFSNAGKSYELQNKISDIFNTQLIAGMDQLFNRLTTDDIILTLNNVDIDIGSIAYDQLEYDLTTKVLYELEKEIKYRLSIRQNNQAEIENDEQNSKNTGVRYLDLLEYFLLSGAMPWWATDQLMVGYDEVMEYLLDKDVAGLKELIIKVGQQGYVRQRLVQQFSESIIRRIITILEPAEAIFIFDYHSITMKTHQQERLIENVPDKEFNKALWLFILTYILVDRGSLFNKKAFVKSALAQMASHYNQNYIDLLTLLITVLGNDQLLDKKNSHLPGIIEALYFEESDSASIIQDAKGYRIFNEDVGGKFQKDIDLIKHYLVFGSLPWWAEPYAIGDIVSLFLTLIKSVPQTLSKLILSIGQTEEVRKRLTMVFNEDIIIVIVELLEPANAQFIINYVKEAQELHQKNAIVKTESKDFKKSVWKFVIDFLIVERGSVFNQRVFLESNIRMLANNYNVQYADMLTFFIQSISQLYQNSIAHVPLFKLLAHLLNDLDQQTSTQSSESIVLKRVVNTRQENNLKEAQRVVMLKDVLLHWLAYGSIPWWGKEYFDWAPGAMFETLLAQAPHDAVLLFKFAGTDANMQQRIIYQLPVRLIFDVLKRCSHRIEAFKLCEYLLSAFTAVNNNNQTDAEKFITLVFWNVFIEGGYKTFDADAFFRRAVFYLNEHYHIEIHIILNELKKKLGLVYNKKYSKTLNNILFEAPVIDNELVVFDGYDITDVNLLINKYLAEIAMSDGQQLIDRAFTILEYYLRSNKLPEQFKGGNPAYVNVVLKQLLVFLNKANKAALKDKLKNAGMYHLYSLVHSKELYAKINESLENTISNLLQQSEPIQKADEVKEALRILSYFLLNDKLPDYLHNINTEYVLKQLLIRLTYETQSALNDLLQKDEHATSARMRLHNIFSITKNTAENNVGHLLKPYFEQDALLYIKKMPELDISSDKKLIELIAPYLEHPQKHIQFIMALLKHQAIAGYIALNYTNDWVFSLLDHSTSVIGGSANLTWLKQLNQLFKQRINDTLTRDRFDNLFREFNLLILGGHINAKTSLVYLKAFFRFISSSNYSLFVNLSDALSHAEINSLTNEAINLPLILQELHLYQQNDKDKRAIEKLLTKTNDQVLQRITGVLHGKQKSMDAKHIKEELINNQQLADAMERENNTNLIVNNKDTIYIKNAGLVLLNPFLATYFVKLGIMEGGKFINVDVQLRAVHLLQYLVNVSQQSAEHELILNKILCNVPLEEAVPIEIVLTDNEKNVSAELFKAVLNSWDKLKNTSIPGFQTSFLQRNGAITFTDDAWHLKVEQRGYDILLQTLPWTIGMIKTPWMDNYLYVEWT